MAAVVCIQLYGLLIDFCGTFNFLIFANILLHSNMMYINRLQELQKKNIYVNVTLKQNNLKYRIYTI